jgi:hypothetical protein
VVVAYCKTLSRNLPVDTKENHQKSRHGGWPRQRLESNPQINERATIKKTVTFVTKSVKCFSILSDFRNKI